MDKTTHTPGPWSIGYNGHNISIIYGSDGLGVAQTYLPLNTGADEIPEIAKKPRWARDLANARLISAAPDLLEALLEAKFRMFGAGPSIGPLYAKVRAAIDKATGAA